MKTKVAWEDKSPAKAPFASDFLTEGKWNAIADGEFPSPGARAAGGRGTLCAKRSSLWETGGHLPLPGKAEAQGLRTHQSWA